MWGRQSAFWEYLWCSAQHCPFLLLTAPIHLQGQYAVLITAMDQRRWEISSDTRHTGRHRKCFDIMTHRDNKMFAYSLISCFRASLPQQDSKAQKTLTIVLLKWLPPPLSFIRISNRMISADSRWMDSYNPCAINYESLGPTYRLEMTGGSYSELIYIWTAHSWPPPTPHILRFMMFWSFNLN